VDVEYGIFLPKHVNKGAISMVKANESVNPNPSPNPDPQERRVSGADITHPQ
jgi:hypothetical protein